MSTDDLYEAIADYERKDPDPRRLLEIQDQVGDLLIQTLEQFGQDIGYWEKDWLAEAIDSYLGHVVLWAPMTTGLRRALQAIDNAVIPPEKRNEDYVIKDETIRSITYDVLLEKARAVRERVR